MRALEFIRSKPWLGWSVAGLLMVLALILFIRGGGGGGEAYTFDRMSENVTVRDRVTGEEWVIPRGRMEVLLLERGDELSTDVGLPNPKTGTLTGFPKSDWEMTVERLNRDRKQAAKAYGRTLRADQDQPAERDE